MKYRTLLAARLSLCVAAILGGISSSSAATITANNDLYSTPLNTPLSISATAGVLANDTSSGVTIGSASIISGPPPSDGTLTFNSDGSFVFDPTAGFTGDVTFTYQDQGFIFTSLFIFQIIDSNVATVQIEVGQTPLPAALPLFATGLAGLGLLGWRRKRKAQAVA